ncbi:MAG: hypothetical protein LC785_16155 [Acidobacteria bacterium]|nr:hypothetical protein [Acidobacteriota bacterium]MCA1643437.1 hypothetical protein [Acidobacteriota bacterium]
MKSVTLFACGVLALIFSCPSRSGGQTTSVQSVAFVQGEKETIRVAVTNRGDKKYDSANVKGPVEVWLRIWKPTQAQSLTETEPKATSHLWGGVLKLNSLAAGETGSVNFVVARPPGGWEMKGDIWVGPNWINYQDPLRLRIVARVDPKNAVKESDESNNNTPIFAFAPPVELAGPVLSIKEVQQPINQPVIKVLVENLGKQKSWPGAKIKFQLRKQVYKNTSQDPNVDVFYWVTGKPAPHNGSNGGGGWGTKSTSAVDILLGGKSGPVAPLTQQDIDALPPTTKIPQTFQKSLPIPPLAPGESVWLAVDFSLPDPGTYVAKSATYIKALTESDECSNLTAFFASHPRIDIRIDQKGSPSVVGARKHYEEQLSPSYFKFMNIPPGKYDGKCK